jgi:ATP phosphoribosyltransferase regulatory subunit
VAERLSLLPFFAERGCAMAEVNLLQPAEPFLDTAGEDLRRRIFITADASGADLCLRPEFTIPVCLRHIAHGNARARYAYEGTVFRQRRDEPAEFRQAGIEDLGETDRAAADARAIADCLDALARLGVAGATMTLGDQAVFEAALAALDLPAPWRRRMARAFGDLGRLKGEVARLSGEAPEPAAGDPQIARLVAARDEAGLAALVGRRMAEDGVLSAGGRTPGEIARRAIEQATLAAVRLDAAHRSALEAFLGLEAPLARAADALADCARAHGLGIGSAIAAFAARAEAIPLQHASAIRYRAAFGRSLEYYTGVVFEVAQAGAGKPVAGGGRYDRLLGLLGARSEIPAVGFSIWLDRAEAAR